MPDFRRARGFAQGLLLALALAPMAAGHAQSSGPLPAQPQRSSLALVLVNGAALSAEAQAQLRRALMDAAAQAGHAPKDLSALTSGIFEAGMLVPAFDRKPPSGWPEPLRALWEEGSLACREQVGAARKGARSRLMHATASVECQRILAEALYARLLSHLAPDSVLEVTVRPAGGGRETPLRIQARLFRPDATKARYEETTSTRSALAEGVARLARAILATPTEAQGRTTAAPARSEIPARPTPTVSALEEETLQPKLPELTLALECVKKLPARLTLTPAPTESRFAATLAQRWDRTLRRAAEEGEAALTCTLRGYPTHVHAGGETVPAVEVILACGETEFRAGAPLDPSLRRRRESLHDVLSASLIRQVAQERCGE